jgi:hypothetical protein
MPELFRTRDCVVYFKDDSTTVTVDDALAQQGWPGGQGVQWVDPASDDFIVTFSRGFFGGFLVWGSDEAGDDHTAITRNQPHYRFATMLWGAALFSTSTYERYTWASRQVGPLVPLSYSPDQRLYLSLRGLWTNEDELTLSGDPDAPSPLAGIVARIPKALNDYYLGVQTVM